VDVPKALFSTEARSGFMGGAIAEHHLRYTQYFGSSSI
jgi:hypothetical protein